MAVVVVQQVHDQRGWRVAERRCVRFGDSGCVRRGDELVTGKVRPWRRYRARLHRARPAPLIADMQAQSPPGVGHGLVVALVRRIDHRAAGDESEVAEAVMWCTAAGGIVDESRFW